MLKQELIHSHILVAIFCGWEPQKPRKEFPNGCLILNETEEVHIVSNDKILEELPYATDWNYLHAAWEELVKKYDEIEEEKEMDEILKTIESSILNNFIDLTFRELVRGIERVNQLKLQES